MEPIERGLAPVAAGLCVLLFFEWHTDEPLVVLPVLLALSFAGGWIAPRRFVLSGLTFGLAILVAHALSDATGTMVPRYQKQPPTTGDWIAMSMLVLPAIGAAFAGARLSRLRR